MGVEKGIDLTPKEKEMFVKGLKQALTHIDKAKELIEDPSQPSEELQMAREIVEEDIAWHEKEMAGEQ